MVIFSARAGMCGAMRLPDTTPAAMATATGAWVSYEDLEARYAVSDPAAGNSGAALTPEGHTANGNVFRDVTGVRWTYYDIPAVAQGDVAFPLDDVALLGVARYEDTRRR